MPVISVTGADPYWHGGPSREFIKIIYYLTLQDPAGRLYYRWGRESWRRLSSLEDYAALNAILDGYRTRQAASRGLGVGFTTPLGLGGL